MLNLLLIWDPREAAGGLTVLVLVKKHVKTTKEKKGGIISKENFLHISNVAILNAQTQKADRITYQTNDEGVKQRVYRSNGEVVATA